MRLGTVLDVGVRILRRHWAPLLLLALLFSGPGALLTAATGARFYEVALDVFPGISEGVIEDGAGITEEELPRITGALGAYFLATIAAGLLASIGALAFSAIVAADYHARRIGLPEALRICLRRTPSAIAFIVITTLIVAGIVAGGLVLMLLVLSVLPAGGGGGPGAFLSLIVVVAMVAAVLYLTMRWAPAFPAMVNEDIGARAALRRSWHLSADNVWRIVFIVVFGLIASALIASVISQLLAVLLAGVLAPAVGLDELVAESVALALGSVLLAPLAPVLTAVLYFDLRTRRDGPVVEQPAPDPYR
jgi:hypothetical protein